VKEEQHSHHHKPMPMKSKKEDSTGSSVLRSPSCSKCGATLDLEVIESYGSMRIDRYYYDGKSYYCNNPLCAPDEQDQKHRSLPFSWWKKNDHDQNHHHQDHR
jgi:hypothetical protein